MVVGQRNRGKEISPEVRRTVLPGVWEVWGIYNRPPLGTRIIGALEKTAQVSGTRKSEAPAPPGETP